MIRSVTLPGALVAVGLVLLVVPALLPVQPVLYHDTRPGTMANESVLEEQGYTVIAYENLSARGQEYYVRALRNGGESVVPRGEGAPEFSYPTERELGRIDDFQERIALQTVVVERPPNASLPPPDEHVAAAEHRLEAERRAEERRKASGTATPDGTAGGSAAENETPAGPTLEELRQRIGRYDQMTTRTGAPPLFSPRSLLRLLAVAGGVVAIGAGGYFRSKP